MNDDNSRTWEDHWAQGHIPWDAGRASPSLDGFLTDHVVPEGGRALVAGCGSGYDVFRLAQAGYTATGVDVAPSVTARFESARKESGLSADRAQLVVRDFFGLSPDDLGGTFELIWDYTFYCAIDPSQRDAWRDQMARLLSPDGKLLMLLFPVVPGKSPEDGPPYPLDPLEVTRQLSPKFNRVRLEQAALTHPGREGKEWFSLWSPGTRT